MRETGTGQQVAHLHERHDDDDGDDDDDDDDDETHSFTTKILPSPCTNPKVHNSPSLAAMITLNHLAFSHSLYYDPP